MLMGSASKPRQLAETRGRNAEAAVAAGWRDRGYDILAERLRTGAGEIDLVVANNDHLIFIEVKARKTLREAAYAVTPRQQTRLLNAASAAMADHAEWERPSTRFDVALVCGDVIEHITDAIRYH
jgi:putative endonuclease